MANLVSLKIACVVVLAFDFLSLLILHLSTTDWRVSLSWDGLFHAGNDDVEPLLVLYVFRAAILSALAGLAVSVGTPVFVKQRAKPPAPSSTQSPQEEKSKPLLMNEVRVQGAVADDVKEEEGSQLTEAERTAIKDRAQFKKNVGLLA